ncbi:MAG TPA: M28 family peptidase [Polyangiaceae bacterium]|nr:M28 family peptidase [Polyangiaceae bacterium]
MLRKASAITLSCFFLACSGSESAAPAAPADAAADVMADAGSSACDKTSAASLRDCVQRSALESDMQFVAKPRSPGSAHWQAVQDLCKSRFEQYGFSVNLQNYATGVNVVGIKQGTDKASEEVIVSAHYDHISGCAGADDNATGVAGVLETARVLAGATFSRTLVLACWDEEESGLIGAEAYAAQAKSAGSNIIAMYSLEMLGYFTTTPNTQKIPQGIDLLFPQQYKEIEAAGFVGDFLTLIPDTSAAFAAARVADHAKQIGLRTVTLEITDSLKSNPLAQDVRRSDHAAFWDQDFPAMLLTDSSEFRNPNYHCRNGTADTVDTLDMAFLTNNTRVVVGSTVDLLELK